MRENSNSDTEEQEDASSDAAPIEVADDTSHSDAGQPAIPDATGNPEEPQEPTAQNQSTNN